MAYNDTTTAIAAKDFTQGFNMGTMRHIVAALDQTPVILTTARRSGHTLIGVTLIKVTREATAYRTPCLEIEHNGHRSLVVISEIGDVIIPMVETSAKWAALNTEREESDLALDKAKAEFPELQWGAWVTEVAERGVAVTYTPFKGNEHYAAKRGKKTAKFYKLSELA